MNNFIPDVNTSEDRAKVVCQIINWLSANADAIAQDNNTSKHDVYDVTDLLANFYPEEEES